MDNKTINKLKLFLTGLIGRYEDTKDFFVALEVEFKEKNKKITGRYEENFKFGNETYNINFDEVIKFILDKSHLYEELKISYIERGKVLYIIADNKNVVTKQENIDNNLDKKANAREYYIKEKDAQKLLQEIDIMTKDGKIKSDKIRKYNQIDHFVEIISYMLEELPKNKTINILDCACGKSYLSFVLNFYIVEVLKRRCNIVGIDYNENVIQKSIDKAKKLGYKNMKFECKDLFDYESENEVDILMSLHGCDNATDYAIAKGIKINAKNILVVPCCHKEFIEQIDNEEFNSVIKHNIFRARFNDVMTDALRCLYLESKGYDVSALEYISPLDTPKNILIRATKKKDENLLAKKDYDKIKKMFKLNPIIEKL